MPYIQQVHDYLTQRGFPQSEATAPERSFHLVGDEKWIDEKGGRKLLEAIGVWEQLKVTAMPDPLMFAVHLQQVGEQQGIYRHLIVENKTTYYAILPILSSLPYATLIYGAGWKVVFPELTAFQSSWEWGGMRVISSNILATSIMKVWRSGTRFLKNAGPCRQLNCIGHCCDSKHPPEKEGSG